MKNYRLIGNSLPLSTGRFHIPVSFTQFPLSGNIILHDCGTTSKPRHWHILQSLFRYHYFYMHSFVCTCVFGSMQLCRFMEPLTTIKIWNGFIPRMLSCAALYYMPPLLLPQFLIVLILCFALLMH